MFYFNIQTWNEQRRCPNLVDRPNLPDFTLTIFLKNLLKNNFDATYLTCDNIKKIKHKKQIIEL